MRAALIVVLTCAAYAQNPIRIPVRLVSVPTLVFSPRGSVVSGLEAKDFTILDNGIAQRVQMQTDSTPPSIVIAIQADPAAADYLSFVAKTGALIENLLLGEGGRAAVISYGDDVKLVEPFGSGYVAEAVKRVSVEGAGCRMIDAGMEAVKLLKQEDRSRPRILLYIGQSKDAGSEAKLANLVTEAEAESIAIHCLTLPIMGKSFVADTFSLRGKNEDKGGFVASADLTKLVPALREEKRQSAGQDIFSVLAGATGGTQIRFRKQEQLENGLIAIGTAIRSSYLLTYSPQAWDAGYHRLSVSVDRFGDRVYSRPGYWMDRQ